MTAQIEANVYADYCFYCEEEVPKDKGIMLRGKQRDLTLHRRCWHLIGLVVAGWSSTELYRGSDNVYAPAGSEGPIFSGEKCRNDGYIVPPRRKPGGS